ncbi:uncharacterized protein SCODWIG_03337 [Saccharomycodes ludwigii]|uniref:Uncharacterized protein n=1 Tax=Saccharomycodes ludwigii TaxID=36035 RepID=A0A376BA77_9ASCO|nr:uncharacterized protein SCODWIG_03337 [Saccharomycodes ludwigii]
MDVTINNSSGLPYYSQYNNDYFKTNSNNNNLDQQKKKKYGSLSFASLKKLNTLDGPSFESKLRGLSDISLDNGSDNNSNKYLINSSNSISSTGLTAAIRTFNMRSDSKEDYPIIPNLENVSRQLSNNKNSKINTAHDKYDINNNPEDDFAFVETTSNGGGGAAAAAVIDGNNPNNNNTHIKITYQQTFKINDIEVIYDNSFHGDNFQIIQLSYDNKECLCLCCNNAKENHNNKNINNFNMDKKNKSYMAYFQLPVDDLKSPFRKFTSNRVQIYFYEQTVAGATYISELHDFEDIVKYPGFYKVETPTKLEIYNPFLSLRLLSISKEQSNFHKFYLYPRSEVLNLYFRSIECLTNDLIYFQICSLWNSIMWNNDKNTFNEWKAFSYLLLTIVSTSDFCMQYIQNIKTKNGSISADYQYFEDSINIYKHTMDGIDLKNLMPSIMLSLHLIREELLLNLIQQEHSSNLSVLLYSLSIIMNWPDTWSLYYIKDIITENRDIPCMDLINKIRGKIIYPHPLTEPISIIEHLYELNNPSVVASSSSRLQKGTRQNFLQISHILEESEDIDVELTPRTYKLIKIFEALNCGKNYKLNIFELFQKYNLTKFELETYPLGIYSPLMQLITNYEKLLENVVSNVDMDLVSRVDLKKTYVSFFINANDKSSSGIDVEECYSHLDAISRREIGKQQKIITYNDIIADILNTSNECGSSKDGTDGESLLVNANKIFNLDKRFNTALRLLAFFQPAESRFLEEVESNYDLRRKFVNITGLRQVASAIGWGQIVYSTCIPLPTEQYKRPTISFTALSPSTGRVYAGQTDLFHENVFEWGAFHSGVSAALKISKYSKGLDSHWVSFNKPKNLTVQYGGFLFGLGLNGLLKNLEEWQIYNLLGPKYTSVSIGVLLGMCASLRGSMNVTLNKLLCVHVDAFLPAGSNDLNVDYQVQTAGLVGAGMLFEATFNKKLSESLFGCLYGFVKVKGKPTCNEGYRIAAGIGLGLVNLGSAKRDLISGTIGNTNGDTININMVDSDMVDRLVSTIISNNDVETPQILDNSFIGSIISLMLIYLKSNNFIVARKLALPFDKMLSSTYVRPEFFFYREWCFNMIMWDSITSDQLKEYIKTFAQNVNVHTISTDDLPKYYKLAGFLLSFSIKHVSSNDKRFLKMVLPIVDRLSELYNLKYIARLDLKLSIKNIGVVTNILLLSLSLVFCGSGNLDVFKRIKYIHESIGGYEDIMLDSLLSYDGPSNTEEIQSILDYIDLQKENMQYTDSTEDMEDSVKNSLDEDQDVNNLRFCAMHYSKYMSSSMAIGFLFLGCGQYSLNISNINSLAYLLIALMPCSSQFPFELQETKHFWSLAAEPRCLIAKNAITNEVISDVSIKLTLDTPEKNCMILETPCLLPSLSLIEEIRVISSEYYPLLVNLKSHFHLLRSQERNLVLYLKPKVIDFTSGYYNQQQEYKNGVLLGCDRPVSIYKKENIENDNEEEGEKDPNLKNIALYTKRKTAEVYSNLNATFKNCNCRTSITDRLMKQLNLDNERPLQMEFSKGVRSEEAVRKALKKEVDKRYKKLASRTDLAHVGDDINLDMISIFEDSNYQLDLWKTRHDL